MSHPGTYERLIKIHIKIISGKELNYGKNKSVIIIIMMIILLIIMSTITIIVIIIIIITLTAYFIFELTVLHVDGINECILGLISSSVPWYTTLN